MILRPLSASIILYAILNDGRNFVCHHSPPPLFTCMIIDNAVVFSYMIEVAQCGYDLHVGVKVLLLARLNNIKSPLMIFINNEIRQYAEKATSQNV